MGGILIAGALLSCGWLVVEPAVPRRKPTPPAPPVDIETPAGRARLAAALALARMPDGPAPSAASSASSTGASARADGRKLCGEDQLPVYAELQPDPEDGTAHAGMPEPDPDGILRHLPGEIKPAGVGYTGAMARIDAALRGSVDPFDRSVADWLDLNKITPPAARTEALVQDALAVSDPRVYRLAYASCHPWVGLMPAAASPETPGCARLSATRLAQLDPGNAEPWLWVLAAADERGDAVAAREALDRMAASSSMDLHFFAGAAAVSSLDLPNADVAAQSMAVMQALGTPTAPFSPLTARCRNGAGGDAGLAATCSRIAELMVEHSDSIIGLNVGGSIHKLVTGDASWLDRAHQEEHQAGVYAPTTKSSEPCSGERQAFKDFVRLDKVGEVALMREKLRAANAP